MSIVKLNNKAVSNATAFGSISSLGSMTFIKKLTASSSATLSFVDGTDGVVLDDTYKEYVFTFNNIHGSATAQLKCNFSTDGGSNYNVTKTTTFFIAYHFESGSETALTYETARDLAQSTSDMFISSTLKTDNDSSYSGEMKLFNPNSSVFVKHFLINGNSMGTTPRSINDISAGYGNTTSPINAIRFQMSSGDIDAGDICLYGIA